MTDGNADGNYGAQPSVVEPAAEFGIATSTAQQAPAHLEAEGLVRAEAGLGSFVAERPEVDA